MHSARDFTEDDAKSSPPRSTSRRRVIEDVLLILAIVPLWPALVLRWPGWIWDAVLWVDLAFLVVLLIIRLNRLRGALRELKGADRVGPFPGSMPPSKDR